MSGQSHPEVSFLSSGDEAGHRSILYSADPATNPDGSPVEDIEEAALLSELQRVQRDIATRRGDRRRRLELQLLQARRELEAEQREDMAILSSSPLATTSGTGHRAREATHQGPRRRVSPARVGAQSAQSTRHTSPGRHVPEASRRSPTDAAIGGDSQALLNAGSDAMRQSRPRGGDAEISRLAGHSAQAGGRHDFHLSGDRPQGRARSPSLSQGRGLSVPRESEQLNPRELFRDGYELPDELLAQGTAEPKPTGWPRR